jgi:hypothetical protein
MNIFVLDNDPAKAVAMLADCHVRKQCVETAQILSGVMLRRGMPLYDEMPKPQNVNHPVIVAADNDNAINWVLDYNVALLDEFQYRFAKKHAYRGVAMVYIIELMTLFFKTSCKDLAKCCGDMDTEKLDIVTAYRRYYTEVKKPQLLEKNLWHFTKQEDWTK